MIWQTHEWNSDDEFGQNWITSTNFLFEHLFFFLHFYFQFIDVVYLSSSQWDLIDWKHKKEEEEKPR